MMRIVTGKAKGIRLDTLEGESTRPTSERVKEAIFSAIQFELSERRVLDLFAGSGQLALEALSRGASSAMFVDSSAEAMAIIKENAKKTGFFDVSRFLISDYRNYIRKASGRDAFDLIFIDPPYADKSVADAVSRIISAGIANDGCIFVLESGDGDAFGGNDALAQSFTVRKCTRYGKSFIHILEYTKNSQGVTT